MKKSFLFILLFFPFFSLNTFAMHQSWDLDFDSINDCEKSGTCDDSIDYNLAKTYKNSAEFLKNEGQICKSATDGCNNVSINNGELGAMTMMYCEDIYGEKGQEKWSCNDYDETKVNKTSSEEKICTMDYTPVCTEVEVQCITTPCLPIQETFSNKCMAGNKKVLYSGECKDGLNIELFKKYSKYENNYLNKIKNKEVKILEKGLINADKMMEKAKLMRFAKLAFEKYITKLVFLKELFTKELNNRN